MPNRPITHKERIAWDFAKESHINQIRKFTNLPYFDAHVSKVNGIVKMYTKDENLLCASLLHDVIEDCFKNKEEGYKTILEKFGEEIANLVLELTSDNREMRVKYSNIKSKYLTDKMINMSDGALIVKLCDRLQNVSDAFTASEKFRIKYTIETIDIIENLEKYRDFNKIQLRIVNDIKSKLNNIKSIFNLTT